MKLYLLRHSNADDSQRPLTEKRREITKKIASALKALHVELDLIVSSPFETAEILAKGLKSRRDLAFSHYLIPIGMLTAGNPEINVNLKNGGVCYLSGDALHIQRRATLKWLLTPKILSALS